MSDYIEFLNWPDVEKYKKEGLHQFDKLSDKEIFGIYLEEKNKNSKMTDAQIAGKFDKPSWYFSIIKQRIKKRRTLCEQKLLQSV